MLDRIRAWLAQTPEPAAPPATSDLDSEPGAPFELRLKTIARAQSKLSLRLDELVELVIANHRAVLERLDVPTQVPADTLDEVFDALDRLDDARRSLGAEQTALADGLHAIASRLERFIASRGLRRHAELGVHPEGQRFRVVGTEDNPDVADGVVTQVVRSAATSTGTRAGELVREGEVIVNKRTT